MKQVNLFLLSILLIISCIPLNGQEPGDPGSLRKGAVKVFFDCNSCDMNYTRQQIPYVNYVRDVTEAEVYILVTNLTAGNGGTQFTITLNGQGRFDGMNDTLVYTSNPDETSTVRREKKTNMIKMGLMRYVAKSPLFSEIEIRHNADLEEEEVIDKWNNWVFEISTEPVFESEEANKQMDLRNSFTVKKVTEKMKFDLDLDQFYNREKFIEYVNTDSAETETYYTNIIDLDNLLVLSISDHWSAGFKFTLGSSTRENYKFTTAILPAIEYDIFPYSESTHRQLRILYGIGIRYNQYVGESIYNRMSEDLYMNALNVAFQVRKRWGYIDISLEGSNYFHDLSKNRVELNTDLNFRIFKGLSLSIEGGVAHINDQLNLRKGDISEAERLLKLREIATKYRFEGGIQITYTFGSIYNNVVNPRFGNSNYF
ncbi:MAG: hypothetical protein U0X39_15970 [Bacteroidales bacterium]